MIDLWTKMTESVDGRDASLLVSLTPPPPPSLSLSLSLSLLSSLPLLDEIFCTVYSSIVSLVM